MASGARPAQPKSILRGHKAQIHAAAFIRGNERLVTGDADGFVIVWDLTIMRPRAVWRPHTNAILGISGWGAEKIITHGRDNKLIVWKLGVADEAGLSTALPLDPSTQSRPDPWMLHMLDVNTMNFCSFSFCPFLQGSGDSGAEILVAVPNTLASEAIDIYHLPSQARLYTVKLGDKNGMVMALSISYSSSAITLIAGYENGIVIAAQFSPENPEWKVRYQAKAHNQPILSLDISPDKDFFITSGADAIIGKHPYPTEIQSLKVPDASASGSWAQSSIRTPNPNETQPKSLLSAALQNEAPRTRPLERLTSSSNQVQSEPLKIVNTKHAGQQGLRIRSDGRVFATAGWDNKVRVYSAKTLKELAVLKWHQAGCYAVAFAEIGHADNMDNKQNMAGPESEVTRENDKQETTEESGSLIATPKLVELTVRDKRIKEARSAHWLAAGSKDSKVSLWDVF